MLVSLGAATFTLVVLSLMSPASEEAGADPTRIVQGIAGGLGFIGAGSIIQQRGAVTGLTTAGSLWVTGAIGTACGCGDAIVAFSATAIALLALTGLHWIERHAIRDEEAADDQRIPEDGDEPIPADRDQQDPDREE